MTEQSFLHDVEVIMEHPGEYRTCPDCSGEGGFRAICGFCEGSGCRFCDNGEVLRRCPTCEGRKEVYVIFEDLDHVWNEQKGGGE